MKADSDAADSDALISDYSKMNTIQILDGGESTIQFTGRRKAIMDEAKPSPLSLF